jgi:nickel/cobalt exporter
VSSTPALLAAAAGVAVGHAILPDHWVPLAVLGRTRTYPMRRVARLSVLAGIAHVAFSLLLGAVVIVIGLQFRTLVEHAQDAIVGGVLVATGVLFAGFELTGHGQGHSHDHDAGYDGHGHANDHDRGPGSTPGHDQTDHPGHDGAHDHVPGLASVMVPFGAAASPDLTILPVFLAATTVGVATSIGALLIFAGVTIATILGLTLVAAFGSYQIRGRWLERWGNLLTAVTLIVIGSLIAGGVI